MVAAIEVGGRWNEEAYQFLDLMAQARTRAAPRVLRTALTNAWIRRWTGMIAFTAHDAIAASLVEDTPSETVATDGAEPQLGELLAAW